jgi:hypothetical protein
LESLHIAFIACNRNAARFRGNPSFIYRCENMAAALEAMGYRVSLLHLSSVSLRSRFDVAVFHRPTYSIRTAMLAATLRRRGARVFADVDDLVFDPLMAEYNPGVLNRIVSLKSIQKLYKAHRRALEKFDRVFVSTEPLADHVRRLLAGASVHVIPNAVHRSWVALADATSGNGLPAPPESRAPIVSYFPGTQSHDRDFSLVAGAVSEFLARHAEARLYVTGPLRMKLDARPGQIVHREKVQFEEFHTHVRTGWVNLAPLEDTPFTRCKSALKVLEAGYWDIPTLCSPIADCSRFADAGATGVETESDWLPRLESMLDPARYQTVSANLRSRVLEVANIDVFARKFIELVGEARSTA